MTAYDPSDPTKSLSWLEPVHSYYRRRPDWKPYMNSAVANVYGYSRDASAVFPPVSDASWTPEQLPVEEHRIITPQELRSTPAVIQVDARVLRALDDRPERLLSLNWREFETVVADLLERLGYKVHLSPIGRDGGYDIVAERIVEVVGSELVVVQCKRLTPPHKVGVPIVRQFCTVIDDHKATRGLIATTTTFTSVALKYIDQKKFRVAGVDGDKLQEWFRIVSGRS